MIIWVASYPKSGNTWVRSIISSLVYTKDGIFDFPSIKKIEQYPQRRFLEYFTQDYNNIHEIKKHWITSQERINLDAKIKFFKTHHLNCKVDNYPFTNKGCTRATIYIVRDPRNLIDSISNHFSKSIEESKKFLLTSKILSPDKEIELRGGNVITYIGSWKEHYRFWTNDNENLLIIKYEDLVKNIHQEIDKIIAFLKNFITFEVSDTKKENIIKSTSFEALKKIEDNGDFTENVFVKGKSEKVKFFNKGPSNVWQNTLPKNIQKELETELNSELKELGYL
ncbi:sulfotransferase domain-containing protein [Candidatus Pelagibacter sp. RS39]|uniref:sulfotransferase domain-containing protein n=1 Tax=Candidatus Pelagibacter sp. RS39 TaxID=1977864 RepID=UPI000A14C454|nr:sulfotransferase domain-containing protein [Candidatus Pelagibacter sp. RS39]ARJ47300.1 hypothetical protein B5L73_00445 [Candidatus Pelagibacter sp. RS39]